MYCGFYTDSSEIYGVVERESDRDECKREREREGEKKRKDRKSYYKRIKVERRCGLERDEEGEEGEED